MAAVCMQTKMLCVLFFIFCAFSSISSRDIYLETRLDDSAKTKDYFVYDIRDEASHILKKRASNSMPSSGTEVPTSASGSASNINVTTTTTTSPSAAKNETISISPEMMKETKDKDKEKKPYDLKASLTKNLGENGAGIRKIVPTAVPPVSSSSNISGSVPLLQHTSNSTNHEITITENGQVVAGFNRSANANINTNVDDSDLSYPNIFDAVYNRTMAEHNITKTTEDHHQFYNSTLTQDKSVGQNFWIHMNKSDVKISELLSQSHRRAATVRLSFEFPFYGHLVRNITIATGGFLYTGEYVHSWLAATQYIAPLMANFDTSLSNDSFIKYHDNGTAFTVQWENVALQDKPNAGNFTFQTTLLKNGDIIFVYKTIPITIEDIQDDHHPVKVGLSDAYISDRTIFFVRRKTIYEYHRVNFNRQDIKNWTSIYLSALPTCLSNKNCTTCVSKFADLKCMWCPGMNRCSSGMDRNRQGWLSRGCEHKKITDEAMCAAADVDDGLDVSNHTGDVNQELLPHYKTSLNHGSEHEHDQSQSVVDQPQQQPRITQTEKPVSMGVSTIVTILFLISFVLGLGIWVMYAYRNPHSTSGQILIRYRPSQWSWKRGEARYTAATIHM